MAERVWSCYMVSVDAHQYSSGSSPHFFACSGTGNIASFTHMCSASSSFMPSKHPPFTVNVSSPSISCIKRQPHLVQKMQRFVPLKVFLVYTPRAPGEGGSIVKAGNMALVPKAEDDW